MIGEYAIPKLQVPETATVELRMDDETFAAFYQRSAPALWAYLVRVSGNHALADDIMQESYLRFLCAARINDGEISCRRYLFKIATNLMRDHWRRPKHTGIEDLPEDLFAVPAEDRVGVLDSRGLLGPALARLRPRERQLLWLAHAEEYSHAEIAEITGLKTISIRIMLFRARQKIARSLQRKLDAGRSR
jgi:RNA polymerase sigma-70 factor (ECF subfamily)